MKSLLRNTEETSVNNEDASSSQYVSLSSFLNVGPMSYKQALTWGVLVFVCTFGTFFVMPFYTDSRATYEHLPAYLFFANHFSDILGRELLCAFVKNSVKGKPIMWTLVLLRMLILFGMLFLFTPKITYMFLFI